MELLVPKQDLLDIRSSVPLANGKCECRERSAEIWLEAT